MNFITFYFNKKMIIIIYYNSIIKNKGRRLVHHKMTIDFCKLDNALLQITIINGALKKKCKCCNRIYDITPNDTLLFEKYIHCGKSTPVSVNLLKNIANDNASTILDQPCTKCNKPFTKLFISNDLNNSFILCSCQFKD